VKPSLHPTQQAYTEPGFIFRYDMENCPEGTKVLLLTDQGIAVIGHYTRGTKGYKAYFPMPKRDRDRESQGS
jgi:hypothetical protein